MNATTATAAPSIPEESGLALVLPGRRVSAGRGASWVAEGWRLFARAPLMWVISIVVLLIVMIVMNFVPILGSIAFQLLQTVIWAGFIAACRSLETGGEFEIEHLLAGFKRRFGSLLLVGLLFTLAGIAIAVAYFGLVGFQLMGAAISGDTEAVQRALIGSIGTVLIGALVAAAVAIPVFAAYWFAPALVFMHGVGPVAAMKASLGASFRNFIPFLVYGVIMFVLAIIAMIPLGLGMLVYVPLAITSAYASYRDIFTDPAAGTDPMAARAPAR